MLGNTAEMVRQLKMKSITTSHINRYMSYTKYILTERDIELRDNSTYERERAKCHHNLERDFVNLRICHVVQGRYWRPAPGRRGLLRLALAARQPCTYTIIMAIHASRSNIKRLGALKFRNNFDSFSKRKRWFILSRSFF